MKAFFGSTVSANTNLFDMLRSSINQSIRTLMQVDKPQRDRVNEYI